MARTVQRRRQFMIDSLDDRKAPRMAPALLAIRNLLEGDGDWHPHSELMAEADAVSDLTPDTVRSRICEAVATGLIEKRGTYSPRRGGWPSPVVPARDGREYRLIDWPDPR